MQLASCSSLLSNVEKGNKQKGKTKKDGKWQIGTASPSQSLSREEEVVSVVCLGGWRLHEQMCNI
jgi:hypothetical protein